MRNIQHFSMQYFLRRKCVGYYRLLSKLHICHYNRCYLTENVLDRNCCILRQEAGNCLCRNSSIIWEEHCRLAGGTVKAGILRNMSAILNWGENCGNSKAKGFAQASGLYCR